MTAAARPGTARARASEAAHGGSRVFGSGGGAKPESRKPKEPSESFAVGDLVDHKAFGRGRVTSVNGDALEIRFDRTGDTKKLLVGYAPIVKIKS